ncbi:hypothetical protein IWW50_003083 [Coemansia erecta]|nr:hypothetical protein GGF43_000512 [Coemansia sp. RSA 2618]KAJ2824953.1 hypothetical protein IWW50_003083 [Coemansia erecta]
MDVVKDNFGRALGEFTEAIGACDFAAIDMEMTGLYETRDHQPSRQDTLDERYAKLKRSVEAFGVVQVGVCVFTWVADGDSGYYEARPFNFNVFPAPAVGGIDVDAHFASKSSALEFLAKNSFDFNKWVYQGIPYLRTETAERLRAERTRLLTSRQRLVTPDPLHADFVADFERALAVFLASNEATLRHETANTYQRKLVYDIVSSYDTLGTKSRAGAIEIFKGSRKAMARHVAHKVRAFSACVDEARGFTAVIDLLSSARKPVVGHNMLLDVLHAYSKFVADLPPARADVERTIAGFLPVLIDTKHIIESTPAVKARYGTSSLDEIAPALEREATVAIRFHPRFTRNVSHNMHEAGFDAYMTGATFIRLLKLDGSSDMPIYNYVNKLYAATSEGTYWDTS